MTNDLWRISWRLIHAGKHRRPSLRAVEPCAASLAPAVFPRAAGVLLWHAPVSRGRRYSTLGVHVHWKCALMRFTLNRVSASVKGVRFYHLLLLLFARQVAFAFRYC